MPDYKREVIENVVNNEDTSEKKENLEKVETDVKINDDDNSQNTYEKEDLEEISNENKVKDSLNNNEDINQNEEEVKPIEKENNYDNFAEALEYIKMHPEYFETSERFFDNGFNFRLRTDIQTPIEAKKYYNSLLNDGMDKNEDVKNEVNGADFPLPNKETTSYPKETIKQEIYDTKITGDLVEKDQISFDIHKLIYSKSIYKNETIVHNLEKEVNENNYQEIINIINTSRYSHEYEIRGYLLALLSKKSILEYQDIFKDLNIDEVLTVYVFAILCSINDKKLKKELTKKMKKEMSSNGSKCIISICKVCLKINESHKYYKLNKLRKLFKAIKKLVNDSDELNGIIISFTKYIAREYALQKPKKVEKFLKNDLFVHLDETNKILLQNYVAKGYAYNRKFSKAKKIYNEILQNDPNNFEAKEGLMMVSNYCTSIYSFVNEKNMKKNKKYNKLVEETSELGEYRNNSLTEIEEINEKQRKARLGTRIRNIRKIVCGANFVFGFTCLILQLFINNPKLITFIYIFLGIYVASSFITTKIKKAIIPSIIRLILASSLVVLGYIGPDLVNKLIDLIF